MTDEVRRVEASVYSELAVELPCRTATLNLTRSHTMIFHAYTEEQRDLRWVTVTLTIIATLLLMCRLSATIKNRGWLGLEDAFVIAANVTDSLHRPVPR